jgi:hypothetical protein
MSQQASIARAGTSPPASGTTNQESVTSFYALRARHQGPLPPEGGSLDSKTYIFHRPATREGVGGGERSSAAPGQFIVPRRALAASSRSGLNVTPRPAPRPRHGQPATANTSPRPPLHEVRFDNTEGAASRKAITSSSDTMRTNPRIGTRPTSHAPRADAEDSSVP